MFTEYDPASVSIKMFAQRNHNYCLDTYIQCAERRLLPDGAVLAVFTPNDMTCTPSRSSTVVFGTTLFDGSMGDIVTVADPLRGCTSTVTLRKASSVCTGSAVGKMFAGMLVNEFNATTF